MSDTPPIGRYLSAPGALSNGMLAPPLLDANGRLVVTTSAGVPIVVVGNDTPADAHPNPTNDVPGTAFLEAFNGATWDRVRCGAVDAGHAAPALGAVDGRAHGYGRDAVGGAWEAILTGAQPASYAARTFGAGTQSTASQIFATDGSTIRPLLMQSNIGALWVFPAGTRPDGNSTQFQLTTGGRLYTVGGLPTPADTAGDPDLSNTLNDSDVIVKASAGWLLGFNVQSEVAAGYFQVFNKASIPVLNDVPVFSWRLPTGTTTVQNFSMGLDAMAGIGKRFGTGIAVGWSSTKATYTSAAFTGAMNVFFV